MKKDNREKTAQEEVKTPRPPQDIDPSKKPGKGKAVIGDKPDTAKKKKV